MPRKNNVAVRVYDVKTNLLIEEHIGHNLVTLATRNIIRDMFNGGWGNINTKSIALGTGDTVATPNDIILENEIYRTYVESRIPGNKNLVINYFLNSLSLNGQTLTEAGLFNENVGDSLYQYLLDIGCSAIWKFNEESPADTLINYADNPGISGQISGSVNYRMDSGIKGNPYLMKGDGSSGFVNIPNGAPVAGIPGTGFSIVAVVKRDSSDGVSNALWTYGADGTGQRLHLWMGESPTIEWTDPGILLSFGSVLTDQVYTLGAYLSYDNITNKTYKNGILVSSQDINESSLFTGGDPLHRFFRDANGVYSNSSLGLFAMIEGELNQSQFANIDIYARFPGILISRYIHAPIFKDDTKMIQYTWEIDLAAA